MTIFHTLQIYLEAIFTNQQECIPVGCIPSAAVAAGEWGGGLPGGYLPLGVSALGVSAQWGVCLPWGGECLPALGVSA